MNSTERARAIPVLDVQHISRAYGENRGTTRKNRPNLAFTRALSDVSFRLISGEFVGVMGPSGSGKSTLLNCIATIDRPDSGSILVSGRNISQLSSKDLSDFRRDSIGFIFQDANLLDTLTGFENIALALTIQKVPAREVKMRTDSVAERLSISDVLDKYPYQMSGGQRQRVAAARATITKPAIILADEPTGALDSKSARQLLETLELLNRLGSTILMVTHDPLSASYCSRILMLKDGQLNAELHRSQKQREEFYREVMAVTAEMNEGE